MDKDIEKTAKMNRPRLQAALEEDRKRKAVNARAARAEKRAAAREAFENVQRLMFTEEIARPGRRGASGGGDPSIARRPAERESARKDGRVNNETRSNVEQGTLDFPIVNAVTESASGGGLCANKEQALGSPKVCKKRKIAEEIVESLTEDVTRENRVDPDADEHILDGTKSRPTNPQNDRDLLKAHEEECEGEIRRSGVLETEAEVPSIATDVGETVSTISPGDQELRGEANIREQSGCQGSVRESRGAEGTEVEEEIKKFVSAHSTEETCLRSLPEQVRLCGLWKGLVVSFDTMFELAQRYANSVGEELSCRKDRTGTAYQQIVCVHAGKPQRRVKEEEKKRKRPCKRTNCTWRAL